jgi:methionine sulfoxide reductase heme-binding subunit
MLVCMTTNPTPHLFWITSRAAGFAALILASLAVSLGLLMSTKLLKGRLADLRVTHEVLSLSAIAAIVIHAGALLGDRFMHPSIAAITIPFVSDYKSAWTALGIVAGWSTILLGLSYYARRTIGALRWRKLHRFTALAWLAGLAHALGEGTDAGQLWFLAMIAIVAIPAIGLLLLRVSATAPAIPAGGASAGARRNAAIQPPALGRETLPDLPARGVVAPRNAPRTAPRVAGSA